MKCNMWLSTCSLEVILRAEAVETAQAGDKCDFIGTLIVVPDVASLSMPGKSHCCIRLGTVKIRYLRLGKVLLKRVGIKELVIIVYRSSCGKWLQNARRWRGL